MCEKHEKLFGNCKNVKRITFICKNFKKNVENMNIKGSGAKFMAKR